MGTTCSSHFCFKFNCIYLKNNMVNYNIIIDRFVDYFRELGSEFHKSNLGMDSHELWQTSVDYISNALSVIAREEYYNGGIENKKFLDVGSGVGVICGIAKLHGMHSEGIEINPIYVELSKNLFPSVKIHQMNIENFQNFSDYDVIFYYLPYNNEELMNALRARIESQMKVGAYIIIGEHFSCDEEKGKNFKNIVAFGRVNKIWKKIS